MSKNVLHAYTHTRNERKKGKIDVRGLRGSRWQQQMSLQCWTHGHFAGTELHSSKVARIYRKEGRRRKRNRDITTHARSASLCFSISLSPSSFSSYPSLVVSFPFCPPCLLACVVLLSLFLLDWFIDHESQTARKRHHRTERRDHPTQPTPRKPRLTPPTPTTKTRCYNRKEKHHHISLANSGWARPTPFPLPKLLPSRKQNQRGEENPEENHKQFFLPVTYPLRG